jgi:hypothetical protein
MPNMSALKTFLNKNCHKVADLRKSTKTKTADDLQSQEYQAQKRCNSLVQLFWKKAI